MKKEKTKIEEFCKILEEIGKFLFYLGSLVLLIHLLVWFWPF